MGLEYKRAVGVILCTSVLFCTTIVIEAFIVSNLHRERTKDVKEKDSNTVDVLRNANSTVELIEKMSKEIIHLNSEKERLENAFAKNINLTQWRMNACSREMSHVRTREQQLLDMLDVWSRQEKRGMSVESLILLKNYREFNKRATSGEKEEK